jgi:AbrB family looped-hinge helix DNA binding protein
VARARITSKGQITIPKQIRDLLGVEPGDQLEFDYRDGHLEVLPVRRRKIAEFRGLFPVPHALDFEEERARARAALIRHIMDDASDVDA